MTAQIIQFRPRSKQSSAFQALIAQAKRKILEQANKKKQEEAKEASEQAKPL